MAAGHTHKLYVHGHSPVHALPAQCKLVALLAFVLIVVATPRTAYWAFGGYALLLLAVTVAARIRPTFVLKRLVVETPVVVFAILLPFIATGPRTELLGFLPVSEHGLLGAWNVLAKATLGVVASILLGATTDQRELLAGLERLRMPKLLVQIASFMVRYVEVITDQLRRMRVARLSRGFEARSVRSWPVLAKSVGALFIRSYERGERVHLAMLSRGYTGQLPATGNQPVAGAQAWTAAAALPVLAAIVGTAAWLAL
jgi:cobalt/nickel transport system permease protein